MGASRRTFDLGQHHLLRTYLQQREQGYRAKDGGVSNFRNGALWFRASRFEPFPEFSCFIRQPLRRTHVECNLTYAPLKQILFPDQYLYTYIFRCEKNPAWRSW